MSAQLREDPDRRRTLRMVALNQRNRAACDEEAWRSKEEAAFAHLAEARRDLDLIQGEIRAGRLPVIGGAR